MTIKNRPIAILMSITSVIFAMIFIDGLSEYITIKKKFMIHYKEINNDRIIRESHVNDARDHSFGDVADRYINEFIDNKKTDILAHIPDELMASVLSGKISVTSLPERVRAVAKDALPSIQGLLTATHGKSALGPPWLRPIHDAEHRVWKSGSKTLVRASVLISNKGRLGVYPR